MPQEVEVTVDTDFAGCPTTRKSTSGGIVKFGEHCIKAWSSNQAVIALSSGEAEMVGVTKGATATLGIKSLLADFGVKCPARVWTDSSAAVGMWRVWARYVTWMHRLCEFSSECDAET